MVTKLLIGAAGALISVGLAAPAGASPVPPPDSVPGFLAAARAAGVSGADPAMLSDGYNVCFQLWSQHASAIQVAAGVARDHQGVTSEEAGRFVTAAYNNLCPEPGVYDAWAYSTG